MIIRGKGTLGGLMEPSLGEGEVSLAGVRSPPLRGGPSPWYPALRDEAPKMRGKWFSRRDALCASAWQGRT
jgi:hypothetical protein